VRHFGLIIVGGGLASARAIKAYREAGGDHAIALISNDAVLPYHRPPLSKGYLRDETDEAPFVEDQAFYEANDVELLLQTSVCAVDPGARSLTTEDGRRFSYERLLLATGARPRRPDVPGGDLDGVFTLRSLADSSAIRDAAHTAERAAVVGGGFIGMEVAASLRRVGLEVTLIHLGRGLFDQFGSRALSDQLASLYRERGVDLLLEEEVTAFGGVGGLEHVETASGIRVQADLAVIGVGVVPNVELLAGSGLALGNGVIVNERFETEAPGVYAVGDVANFLDPLFERQRRIEHWSNANYQGTEVGKILAGQGGGYDTVSSFFTEVFGTTIRVFGDTSQAAELSVDGSLESSFLATYGLGDRLVAAISVGQGEELEALLKDLIAERSPADVLARDLVEGISR
jgi:3-phenylpropionate/trans-cinnamate dioxygenase ferredoxin reductase component